MGGDQFMQQWAHLSARAAVQRAPTAPPAAMPTRSEGSGGVVESASASASGSNGHGSATSTAYMSKSNPHKAFLPAPSAPPPPEGDPGAPPSYDTAAHPVYHKKNA